ncbi:hypothetical protein Thiofri_03324 [Thiorhodovibrio frisius]|nr:hypothetical protein Thiofri_03324 [Thiorhodovibrio frisius]
MPLTKFKGEATCVYCAFAGGNLSKRTRYVTLEGLVRHDQLPGRAADEPCPGIGGRGGVQRLEFVPVRLGDHTSRRLVGLADDPPFAGIAVMNRSALRS